MIIYSKNIVGEEDLFAGYIVIQDGKIVDIKDDTDEEYLDYSDKLIFPGFIDQHIHGWGRGSLFYENNDKSIEMMIIDQAKEGVTGFLATTFTDTIESIEKSIDICNRYFNSDIKGAKLLGIHLEGPFINPVQSGAQKSEYCLNPDVELFKRFQSRCSNGNAIRLTTIAPELDGAEELIRHCKSTGVQVSAGHTDATFDQVMKSIEWGVSGVTHMYGAMKGMHHRELGTVGAALYSKDLYCEFAKQTGITVHHEAFDIAFRLKGADRIIHSTDCLGNGMQKEPYYHAKRDVYFIPEGDKLIEKKSDGSYEKIYDLNDYESIRQIEMSYIDSVRNLMRYTEISYPEIAKITSKNPAEYIGINTKGKITKGFDADFTVVDKDFNLVSTIVNGEIVYGVK